MLSDSDIMKLGTAMAEVTGSDLSDPGVRMFAASLDPGITLNDALSLIVEWNGRPHFGNQLRPTDLNELWSRRRPSARLSDDRVQEVLRDRGLSGDALWAGAAPRMLRSLVDRGVGLEEAANQASARFRGFVIEAAPRRARLPAGHHFAGRLSGSLESVLGASNACGAGDLSSSIGKPVRTPKESVSDGDAVKVRKA